MARDVGKNEAEAVEAKWGKRMIEVRVRFWTNDLAASKSQVRPRHAWSSGMVRMEKNEAHGLSGGDPLPFNSLLELPAEPVRPLSAAGVLLPPRARSGTPRDARRRRMRRRAAGLGC